MAAMDHQPVDGRPADIAAAESAVIGIIFVEAHAERTSFEQLCEINTSFATAILMIFRSEEHTSELQSLMRISYAVFCLKKQKTKTHNLPTHSQQQRLQNN